MRFRNCKHENKYKLLQIAFQKNFFKYYKVISSVSGFVEKIYRH